MPMDSWLSTWSPRFGHSHQPQTAALVSELLRSVVVNGNGNRAEVPGYFVAGKTGTAEVPEIGGYGDDIIASFVGFAPVDDPRWPRWWFCISPRWNRPLEAFWLLQCSGRLWRKAWSISA